MEDDNNFYKEWQNIDLEQRRKVNEELKKIRKTDYENLPDEPFQTKKNALKSYHIRQEQEKIGEFYTANLFLNEVKNYCSEKEINPREIFVELKAKLLSDYRGFTGITNPNYVENVKENELMKKLADDTFQKMISNARQLIK